MMDGETPVPGTFAWTNPEAILNAGNQTPEWVFTPTDDAHYMQVTGTASVTVERASVSGKPSISAINTSDKIVI